MSLKKQILTFKKFEKMGTYNKGILGPFSGKVGTVVGASWRGKDIMRSLPKKSNRQPTETQLLQREKFAFVTEFLTPISPVISRYYGSDNGGKTRRNKALSYHMKEAVSYADDTFEIVFNRVLIAKGDLIGPQNPVVTAPGNNVMHLEWQDNTGQGEAKATDVLVLVVYAAATNQFFYTLNAGERQGLTADITLPNYLTGEEVQTWITFVSADGKEAATSQYMGALTIS